MPALPESSSQTRHHPGESQLTEGTTPPAVPAATVVRGGRPRRLVKEREAAEFLGLSCGFLRASRLQNPRCGGPPFIRVGRSVRYDLRDLEDWVREHRLTSVG
jgi:hypothetical protein